MTAKPKDVVAIYILFKLVQGKDDANPSKVPGRVKHQHLLTVR